MVLIKMITAAVLLVYFFCQIEGAKKGMPDDPSWNSDDEDFASGSGALTERGQDCCVSGNVTFHSIADILKNISSNNTIVNITIDVVLSSNVTIEGLENIMIIGHRNAVVKCNDVGAVKFISCKNVTIKGIKWEGCGSKNYQELNSTTHPMFLLKDAHSITPTEEVFYCQMCLEMCTLTIVILHPIINTEVMEQLYILYSMLIVLLNIG